MTVLEPATAPTLYFFGVTTTKSSIMQVFPLWAKPLGFTTRLSGASIFRFTRLRRIYSAMQSHS